MAEVTIDSITENIINFLEYPKPYKKISPTQRAYINLNVQMAYELGGRDVIAKHLKELEDK